MTGGQRVRVEILNQIRAVVTNRGYPPSIRELAEAVGLSTTTVHHHLAVLQSEGRLTKTPGRHRGIRIVEGEDHD